MRGASALQDMLDGLEGKGLRLLVVWEPVIFTDLAPPTTGVLARIADARAVQYWDRSRLLSSFLVKSSPPGPPDGTHEALEEDSIVWDHVMIFPPGARWSEGLPTPDYAGGPVIAVIDEVRRRLSAFATLQGREESGR